jgi:hypothetical protein
LKHKFTEEEVNAIFTGVKPHKTYWIKVQQSSDLLKNYKTSEIALKYYKFLSSYNIPYIERHDTSFNPVEIKGLLEGIIRFGYGDCIKIQKNIPSLEQKTAKQILAKYNTQSFKSLIKRKYIILRPYTDVLLDQDWKLPAIDLSDIGDILKNKNFK